jgi:hypothetical protein
MAQNAGETPAPQKVRGTQHALTTPFYQNISCGESELLSFTD